MSKIIAFFRNQLPKLEPCDEFFSETPQRNETFQKLKRLYDSRGTKSSTLSNDGVD